MFKRSITSCSAPGNRVTNNPGGIHPSAVSMKPPMDYHARRRQQLVRSLKDEHLDALLVSNPVNVTYLTGFSGDSSHLLLSRKRTILVSDGRYAEQITEECPGLEA